MNTVLTAWHPRDHGGGRGERYGRGQDGRQCGHQEDRRWVQGHCQNTVTSVDLAAVAPHWDRENKGIVLLVLPSFCQARKLKVHWQWLTNDLVIIKSIFCHDRKKLTRLNWNYSSMHFSPQRVQIYLFGVNPLKSFSKYNLFKLSFQSWKLFSCQSNEFLTRAHYNFSMPFLTILYRV